MILWSLTPVSCLCTERDITGELHFILAQKKPMKPLQDLKGARIQSAPHVGGLIMSSSVSLMSRETEAVQLHVRHGHTD